MTFKKKIAYIFSILGFLYLTFFLFIILKDFKGMINEALVEYKQKYSFAITYDDKPQISLFPLPSIDFNNIKVIHIKKEDSDRKEDIIFNSGTLRAKMPLMKLFSFTKNDFLFEIIGGNLRVINDEINNDVITFLKSDDLKMIKFTNSKFIFSSGKTINNVNINLYVDSKKFSIAGLYYDILGNQNQIDLTIDGYQQDIPNKINMVFIDELVNANITASAIASNDLQGTVNISTKSNDITVNGNFKTENGFINSNDITIKSQNILDGKINITGHLGKSPNLNLNLDLDYFNISNFGQDFLDNFFNKFFTPSETYSNNSLIDLQGKLNIKIDNVIYKQNTIGKFLFESDIYNNLYSIYNCRLDISNQSIINTSGSLKFSDLRPEFIGNFTVNIDDEGFNKISLFTEEQVLNNHNLKLNSDIRIIPGNLTLSNMTGNINNKSDFSGLLALQNRKNNLFTEIGLDIKDIDFNDYIGDRDIILDYINMAKNVFYRPLKLESTELIDKLRVINNILVISLNVNNFKYNAKEYDNFSTLIELEPTMISFKETSLQSAEQNMKLQAIASVKSLKPEIFIDLTADKIDSNIFLPNKNDTPETSFLEQTPTIFTLSEYEGYIKINADELKYNNDIFNNFNLDIKMDKNVNINNLAMRAFDGNMNLKGIITAVGIPTYSLSFIAGNMNIDKIMAYLGYDITGKANFSTSLSGSGNSYGEILNKSKGIINISSNNLEISGFDFEKITTDLPDARTLIEQQKIIRDAAKSGKSKFGIFDGRIDYRSGFLSTQKINLRNRYGSGFLAGSYNILNNTVNSVMQMSYPDKNNQTRYFNFTTKGVVGKELEKKFAFQDNKKKS